MNTIVKAPSMTEAPATLASQKSLKGRDVGIPVRPMTWSYDQEMPTFWMNNNAFMTMFLSGFSATLPDGEGHFIHSVRLFQDQVTDPVLLAQVRAFIGQEAHHSKQHDAFNHTLEQRGIDLHTIEQRMKKMVQRWKTRLSPKQQLAMTVCAEHFTALLADQLLSKNPQLLELMAPQARNIWAWHSIEEAEHKAVAFDVYQQTVGDRELLKRTMIGVTAMLLGSSMYNALTLMKGSGQLSNLKMWKESVGILRKIGVSAWSDYKDFFKADFHPWQHDNRAALARMKRLYLNEDAA